MKKFYCVIPYQQSSLRKLRYEPVGNLALGLEMEISFPILTAIGGYVAPGEEFRVVAAARRTPVGLANLALFQEQLEAVCREKPLCAPRLDVVELPDGEGVVQQADTFRKLITFAEDGDEIFACMTGGSKPLTTVLLLALQYARQIQQGASIGCVVYGEINWAKADGDVWTGRVYDMTALVQLDETVRLLAQRGVTDPRRVIDAVLASGECVGHG